MNWKPLQPTEARRQLNNAVLHNYNDKTVPMEFGKIDSIQYIQLGSSQNGAGMCSSFGAKQLNFINLH